MLSLERAACYLFFILAPLSSQAAGLGCPSGQFALNNQCVDCHSSCEECSGHEPFECTECGIGEDGMERFLHRNRCKVHCPRGYYQDLDRYICEPCTPNCELCTGVENCDTCKENYKLQNGACSFSECLEGQVEDPNTGECFDCQSGCKTCAMDNPEFCTSCLEGYFLYRHQCYRHCPQKTYADDGRKLCFACPPSCFDCKNETFCSSCQVGYFLFDTACVQTCPTGTFQDVNSGRCEACHSSCQACHGPSSHECDLCPGGGQPAYGLCEIITCSLGWYYDISDSTCYVCDESCQSCFGPLALDCFTCNSGFFLDQDNRCVEVCPVGHFGNLITQICEKCAVNCESCVGSSDVCIQCKNDGQSLFLHSGRCLFNCPDGYFETSEGSCEACDNSCWTCDESRIKCLSCASGLLLENNRCNLNCSLRYYPDADGICKRCPAHCNVCADSSSCSECSYLYLLLNGTCKATCPDGYYEDLDQGKCIPCYFNCATCSGISYDDCESCTAGYPKLYQGECLEECPLGTFYNRLVMECQECDRTCASCSGPDPTDCIQCQHGLSFDPISGRCGVQGDAECPSKTFLHDDLLTCKACDDTCESCSGASRNDCLTCTLPLYLYNNTCEKECPQGMYSTSEDANGVELGYCLKCNPVCSTCNGGSAKDCMTCASGYYKLLHLCILHCPTGYYRGSDRCEKCHPSCQMCSGPRPEECMACPPNTLQLDGTNQCVNQCPERFYQQQQLCKQCHPSCKTCKDSTPEGCLSCDWGSDFKNGVCFPRCEEKYYLSRDEKCIPCDPSCRHCAGPGPEHCVICKANSAWAPTEKRCVHCCDPQTDQPDCCFCRSNLALCTKASQTETKKAALEKSYMPASKTTIPSLNFSTILPVLGTLFLVLVMGGLILQKARSKKLLCWKQSYDRLNGNSQVIPVYEHVEDQVVMTQGNDAGDESPDECDVVYSSRDGRVFRKYCFKVHDDEDGDEDERTCLNKAKC